MSTYLRKCLDIAPTAVITPDPFVANDYRNLRLQPWWPALRATTSHLRLIADWPSLQHTPGAPGSAPADVPSLAALDAQVDAAHADGMQIIMFPYRYPRWANETDGIAPGVPELDFRPWDRFPRLAPYLAYRAGTGTNPGTPKTFEYRMPPEGFGPGSQWGRYVEWLWDRYADRLTAFEVVNEPNGQLWPQRTTLVTDDFDARWGTEGTTLATPPAVAEMMTTVDAIARAHGDGPLLLAPSTSDTLQATIPRYTTISHRTEYTSAIDTFVEALLPELARREFTANNRWLWAYHNYSDFERDYHHVVYLRRILTEHGWGGRQLDGGPEVWCTEGGCRLNVMQTRFGSTTRTLTDAERKDYQARVLTEALSRHHHAKGVGAGVGMVTQYTTYADGFNSGVLDGNGTPRPALAVWSNMPEYVAAPAQRAAWRPQP